MILVVGSVNVDLVTVVERLPRPGETVLATEFRRQVGGKGANQAVAARSASDDVRFVGRVGSDDAAETVRAALRDFGIGTDDVAEVPGAVTGTALIQVGDETNTIVVAPGANWMWTDLDAVAALARTADVVVTQLEVPDDVVATLAENAGGRFVLNAAPARPVLDSVLKRCDPLIVNQHELSQLTGLEADDAEGVELAHEQLISRGCRAVITTLGADGVAWRTRDRSGRQRALQVEVADATGAGDVFCGHVAVQLAAGHDIAEAVHRATVASGVSVGREGTFASYPTREEVDEALDMLPIAPSTRIVPH